MERPVTKLKTGSTAVITALAGENCFQQKLRSIGVREGKRLKVVARQPLGGPIVIEIDGREISIGRRMAERILAETGEERH